jgi:hypothetical protein
VVEVDAEARPVAAADLDAAMAELLLDPDGDQAEAAARRDAREPGRRR